MSEKAQKLLNYLGKHNTMILSTYGENGPWATPVFFINRGFRIYFLSELTSKHSSNLQKKSLSAAVITEDYGDWKEIQGIQLQGNVYLITNLKEVAVLLASYCKKYSTARHILQTPGAFKGVSNVRWHCLVPHYLKFTDNTEKFGQHFELELRVIKSHNGFNYEEDFSDS
ncbi:MAG: hypothetical protein APF81_12255 [Desulfosporosinus sp. BRH_c37]|nr:MAG: hypothetical protein APF81_12255 [Desulfosporosinus sp. BRH_c37]